MTIKTEILIVGAGMAGLMAGNKLQKQGHEVLLVDKGRGVGGRMATRRMAGGRIDHGAQFFTVRTPTFQAYVQEWLEAGVIFEWSHGWAGSLVDETPDDGHVRYAGVNGVTAVAKHLATNLTIHKGKRLASIQQADDGWLATSTKGETYHAQALLMTPPVPQTLTLLNDGGVQLPAKTRTQLERIQYQPCMCGLFHVKGEVNLPEPGALQRPNHQISWLADNQRKGISPDVKLITVHASGAYSESLIDQMPDDEILALLEAELELFLEAEAQIVEKQFMRWRYAIPTVLHPERCLVAGDITAVPLLFAGDAFGGPRVEGAALSGLAAAEQLTNHL